MLNQATNELNRTRSKTAGDRDKAIANVDDLRKAAGEASGEGAAAPRGKFEDALESARARLTGVIQPAVDKSRQTAAAANSYVHGNPWTLIGVAAAGLLIGFLAARR